MKGGEATDKMPDNAPTPPEAAQESSTIVQPGLPPPLFTFIAQLPKVELHLHLEGSIRPQTLEELAQRKSWLRSKAADWLAQRTRESYRYGSFEKFLLAFGLVSLLLEGPEDYALITTRLLEWLASQNVRYAEVTISVGVLLWKKQSVEAAFEAIACAARDAQARTGVRVNWIFDAVRQFGVDHVRDVLGWAKRYRITAWSRLGSGATRPGARPALPGYFPGSPRCGSETSPLTRAKLEVLKASAQPSSSWARSVSATG